jgi:CheY-like chemotaxis protein
LYRILVVDDEPDFRYILRRILERADYEVIDAVHGVAALEVVHSSRPDLIVTDMMMPVMNGAELIRELRADPLTAPIPILAATSDVDLAGCADAVLRKPYRSAELLAAADALLTLTADRT